MKRNCFDSDLYFKLSNGSFEYPDKECVVKVDVIETNYCPGSCMFLFTVYQVENDSPKVISTTLYTGYFRYEPSIFNNTILRDYMKNSEKKIDTIYFDNSTVEHATDLPTHQSIVDEICNDISKTKAHSSPHIDIYFGCYNIDKDRVWLEVAERLGTKISLSE